MIIKGIDQNGNEVIEVVSKDNAEFARQLANFIRGQDVKQKKNEKLTWVWDIKKGSKRKPLTGGFPTFFTKGIKRKKVPSEKFSDIKFCS